MTQETELKPCPFCGDPDAYLEDFEWSFNSDIDVFVTCAACNARGDGFDIWCSGSREKAEQKAIEAWNTRAEDPTKAELKEHIAELEKSDEWQPIETIEWTDFLDDQILEMDGEKALKFWRKYKDFIFSAIELSPAVNPKGG